MESYRLKIKIGEHEFEAEGPADVVERQFDSFRNLIESLPASTRQQGTEHEHKPEEPNSQRSEENGAITLAFDKITTLDGRIVSLTVPAATTDEAILVLLLAQRQLREDDAVTGAQIMDGLRQSGTTVGRVDKILDRLASEGLVIAMGVHRGRRYRLTNAGVSRAQETARTMISLVP